MAKKQSKKTGKRKVEQNKLVEKSMKENKKPNFDKKKLLLRFKKVLKSFKPNTFGQWAVLGVGVVGAVVAFFVLLNDLPSPTKLKSQSFPASTQIVDRNGEVLYEIYGDKNRIPIKLEELPDYVPQASIAIEDQNFYKHFGFSIQGITRALGNIVIKQKLQGGSTITQQLVKTALLTPERTIRRKVREAFLTLLTELLYTKRDILEMYLNHIPYGGTAWGIEAAAKTYFGKPAKELDLAEAALLAGLPQAPTRYSPFTNPESSKARQKEVLRRMVEDGYINQDEADQAASKELEFALKETDIKAPHFVFYIRDLLIEKFGLEEVERGGLKVVTTLDWDIQQAAQASLSAEISRLANYRVGNGAALVTNPNTGEVLAMVGSKDYFDADEDGQVNVTIRPRQPGSSIKPINYVTAMQNKKLTPASVLLDLPTCFLVTGQPEYCPRNYDNSWHGPVSVRSSLGNSYNIPAVKALAINGIEDMIATASAMGITTFQNSERYGLSLTLGGGEVKMVDMAVAFGTLANQGVRVGLQPILRVENYNGKVLEEFDPNKAKENLDWFFDEGNSKANKLNEEHEGLVRALNREPAYLVSHILQDNQARLAAFGGSSELVIRGQVVSVKTGTTNDLRDNWTIGYTNDRLVSVWVGNNDNTPMNPYLVSGVTGAAPIWNDLMSYVLSGRQSQLPERPEGIESIEICGLTGGFPSADQPCTGRTEVFWDQALPTETAPARRGIWVFKDTGLPAFFGEKAPEEVDTSNIELREHLVMSDQFTKEFCLDCPWPIETNEDGTPKEDGKIAYPETKVNMSLFGIIPEDTKVE